MKRTYQDVVKRIKVIALAHPKIYSADDGRELEFDTKKKEDWPRFFIRTEAAPMVGGLGTVELSLNFTVLLMDKLNKERSNVVEVMSANHATMIDVLATLNKEQLIRVTDNPTPTPLYDYQDTQTAGWQVAITVYLDMDFECYTVPEWED